MWSKVTLGMKGFDQCEIPGPSLHLVKADFPLVGLGGETRKLSKPPQ